MIIITDDKPHFPSGGYVHYNASYMKNTFSERFTFLDSLSMRQSHRNLWGNNMTCLWLTAWKFQRSVNPSLSRSSEYILLLLFCFWIYEAVTCDPFRHTLLLVLTCNNETETLTKVCLQAQKGAWVETPAATICSDLHPDWFPWSQRDNFQFSVHIYVDVQLWVFYSFFFLLGISTLYPAIKSYKSYELLLPEQ